jgi:hypothetical protein
LLGGAIGGLTALVAQALARPLGAAANDPNDIVLGGANSTSTDTYILTSVAQGFSVESTGDNGIGLSAFASGPSDKTTYGVYAATYSATGAGVAGRSVSGTGVMGFIDGSGTPTAAYLTGVLGYTGEQLGRSSVGVHGTSIEGRGGVFKGAVAQLRLMPSETSSHPAAGARGDLFADNAGRLWFCKGGTTWKQLA